MSLRSRLAATYAAVILIALLIFAAAAIIAIDRTLRATMDSRLNAEAHAASSLVDFHDGEIMADKDDREQFLALIAAGDDGMVLDAAGNVKLSSAAQPPAALFRLPRAVPRYYTAGKGDAAMRALVLPIVRDDVRVGTVIVWRASDWVNETDRGAAIAFAVAAIVIAALAVIAGGAVTRRALEDAFARQRRFTADASHELRAPLAVIRAEADLALRKDRTPREYRGAMDAIAAEADRMEALIAELLSAARAESGSAARERIDVTQVVRRVAERLNPTAHAKGAAVHLDAQSPAIVVAEREALERAILAIAHNAVEYAPQHGIVTLAVHAAARMVEVSIRDNGPGFTPQALEHALERFWREDGKPRGGSGLGLAIAKSIVEGSGGKIALSNPHGGGAQVLLQFSAA